MEFPQQFGSDNFAGLHPKAMRAIADANRGSARPYGEDSWTESSQSALRALFETDCQVDFVGTGTAANALSLAALCRPYDSVICSPSAHIETDECGAVSFFSGGARLLSGESADDKLTPAILRALASDTGNINRPRPRAVSITQPTERGLVYTAEEIAAISAMCRDLGLILHMDGARFANACAALGVPPADISWKAGVDVLCLGGTKNGMALGEAILFFNPAVVEDFARRRKQAGHIPSKMRFLSAPWRAMVDGGHWLDNAVHANRCAAHLKDGMDSVSGIEILWPVETNMVFLKAADGGMFDHLHGKGWEFYSIHGVIARFVFSWDSAVPRIDELVRDMKSAPSPRARQYSRFEHPSGES